MRKQYREIKVDYDDKSNVNIIIEDGGARVCVFCAITESETYLYLEREQVHQLIEALQLIDQQDESEAE
jgi:hypothetical protein